MWPRQGTTASKALGARAVGWGKHGALNEVDEAGVRATSLEASPHPPRSDPAAAAVLLLYCTMVRNTSA